MKKYPEYKDSGVEWIGKIPKDWVLKKITHGFKGVGSGTTPSSSNVKYYTDGTHNWLQTGDLTDNVISKTSKKITNEALKDYSTLRIYPLNSLIIAMYGATIGKVGILKIESTTNQACCVLSQGTEFLTEYVFYWFIANKPHVISMGYGGGQPDISQETIKSLRIPCPSLSEQYQIVDFLDHKTRQIDDLIAKKQKLIELLKEERTVLINRAVTKGLNHNVPMKDSGVEWLGEIPEHWLTKRLDLVCDVIDPQPDHRAPQIVENGYPYLGIRDINDDGTVNTESARKISLEAVEKQEKSFCINDGDIVFCKVGTLGLPRFIIKPVGRFAISATLVLIKNFRNINTKFLFYILQSYFLQNQISVSSTGSTRQALGIEIIRRFLITFPPLSEQERIAAYLDRNIDNCQAIVAKIQNEIDLMNEYKTSLINEAVTGKIKVSDAI